MFKTALHPEQVFCLTYQVRNTLFCLSPPSLLWGQAHSYASLCTSASVSTISRTRVWQNFTLKNLIKCRKKQVEIIVQTREWKRICSPKNWVFWGSCVWIAEGRKRRKINTQVEVETLTTGHFLFKIFVPFTFFLPGNCWKKLLWVNATLWDLLYCFFKVILINLHSLKKLRNLWGHIKSIYVA